MLNQKSVDFFGLRIVNYHSLKATNKRSIVTTEEYRHNDALVLIKIETKMDCHQTLKVLLLIGYFQICSHIYLTARKLIH